RASRSWKTTPSGTARRPSRPRPSPPSARSSASPSRPGATIWPRTAPSGRSSTSCALSRKSEGGVMPAKATRAAFGEALLDLGAQNARIVTVDADLSKSTMTANFAKKYPDRAWNMGIAEQNMIGIGAGLALAGYVPFVCSFACFLVGRFETIRISVAYTNANVKLVGTHVGVAIGEDGYSQMGLEDVAAIRALPNIPIVQPADELETRQVIAYAVDHDGPLYLRLTRQNLEPVCPPDWRFGLGRWLTLREGRDVTLIGSGGPLFHRPAAAPQRTAGGHS